MKLLLAAGWVKLKLVCDLNDKRVIYLSPPGALNTVLTRNVVQTMYWILNKLVQLDPI